MVTSLIVTESYKVVAGLPARRIRSTAAGRTSSRYARPTSWPCRTKVGKESNRVVDRLRRVRHVTLPILLRRRIQVAAVVLYVIDQVPDLARYDRPVPRAARRRSFASGLKPNSNAQIGRRKMVSLAIDHSVWLCGAVGRPIQTFAANQLDDLPRTAKRFLFLQLGLDLHHDTWGQLTIPALCDPGSALGQHRHNAEGRTDAAGERGMNRQTTK